MNVTALFSVIAAEVDVVDMVQPDRQVNKVFQELQ
jgi:hypothetical protein